MTDAPMTEASKAEASKAEAAKTEASKSEPSKAEPSKARSVSLDVNGRAVRVGLDDPETPLLYVLRDDLGLHGPRFGCGLGQCGSCTVHIDGAAVRSCITPVSSVTPGQKIVTLEGLGTEEAPHPLQTAFIAEQAAQCGYCINGMIMQSAAFLTESPRPDEAAIRQALANNLCRCGTHARIVRAVQRAASAL